METMTKAELMVANERTGKKLKAIRLAMGYTPKFVATMFRLTREELSKIESGSPELPQEKYYDAMMIGFVLIDTSRLPSPNTSKSPKKKARQ